MSKSIRKYVQHRSDYRSVLAVRKQVDQLLLDRVITILRIDSRHVTLLLDFIDPARDTKPPTFDSMVQALQDLAPWMHSAEITSETLQTAWTYVMCRLRSIRLINAAMERSISPDALTNKLVDSLLPT